MAEESPRGVPAGPALAHHLRFRRRGEGYSTRDPRRTGLQGWRPGSWRAWRRNSRHPIRGPARRRLRIATVSSPVEVPAEVTAGSGRGAVCNVLAESLTARGHDVVRRAPARKHPSAAFLPTFSEPPRRAPGTQSSVTIEALHAARAAAGDRGAGRFDVAHDQHPCRPPPWPIATGSRPSSNAHTGRSTAPPGVLLRPRPPWPRGDLGFPRARSRTCPVETIHHGIDADEIPFRRPRTTSSSAIDLDEGVETTTSPGEAASASGDGREMQIDPHERAFFDEEILARGRPYVEWFGEADETQKFDLLARARALLFPIIEFFGLRDDRGDGRRDPGARLPPRRGPRGRRRRRDRRVVRISRDEFAVAIRRVDDFDPPRAGSTSGDGSPELR